MIKNKLFIAAQYVLPQHALSRLAGSITNCQYKPVKNWLIQKFIQRYGVDMSQAAEPNPTAYPSFNAFFTRALKAGARTVDEKLNTVVSPADGTISQIGTITAGRIVQAKGFDFTVAELLGGDTQQASAFTSGHFATIYLAPRDYHRVHMPVSGTLRSMTYIPGKLFSVNNATTLHVPRLFARNERVACIFDTDHGPLAVVMVGAFFVASIVLPFAGKVAPAGHKIQTHTYTPGQVRLAKGAEMGHFELGSTAIILFPQNAVRWDAELHAGSTLQMGQPLGKR